LQLTTVFFDKDGILADIEPAHAAAYVRTFAAFGVAITAAQFRQAVTVQGKRTTEWFREMGGVADDADIYQTKDRMYREIAEGREQPRDGLLNLINDLQAHGINLYVTTGARRILAERLLAHFGIREKFCGILGLEDVRAVKPDPEIYRKAIATAGVAPHQAIVLEDMPRGIVAARGAGLAVVAVPTDPDEDLDFGQAQLVVPSLADLSTERLDQVLQQHWAGLRA